MFLTFLVIVVLGYVTCKTLPSYITPCQRSVYLNECLAANIEAARPYLKKGVEALGVPSLDPYVVPMVKMEGPKFYYEDRNLTLTGLEKFVLKEVDLDMDAGLFRIVVEYPQLNVKTNYTIDGIVFDMDLSASGYCEGQMRDLRFSVVLKRNNKDLKDQENITFDLEKFEMNMYGRQPVLYFDDLVPGNPEETKAANDYLRPRMNELMYMKEPTFKDVFGDLILNVLTNYFLTALYIKPCHKNVHLKECLIANIEAVKPHLKKGVKPLDAPPLDPLLVPLAKFETPTFQFETRDIIIRGVGNFNVNDIDLNLKASLFKISLDFPAVDVETGYSMNGTLFLFNVSGAGFAEGHARDTRMITLLKGSPKHLDDKEYFDFYMEDFKIEMLTNKSSCYFRDLVPGNPEMTDSINALINSRVNDFVYLVEPIFKEVFGGLIANIVKTVFSRYSLDDLFVD